MEPRLPPSPVHSGSDSGAGGDGDRSLILAVFVPADPNLTPREIELSVDSESRLSCLLSEALSIQVFHLLPHGRVGTKFPFSSPLPSTLASPQSRGATTNGAGPSKQSGAMEIEQDTTKIHPLDSNVSVIEQGHGGAVMDFAVGQVEVQGDQMVEEEDVAGSSPSTDRKSIPRPFLYSSTMPPSSCPEQDIKAHINIRASCIAGRPIYGDVILTRARTELHSNRTSSLIRREDYSLFDFSGTLTACFPSSSYLRSLSGLSGSSNSCILLLPGTYSRDWWAGPKPKALLQSYMSMNDATTIWQDPEEEEVLEIKAVRCHFPNTKTLSVRSHPCSDPEDSENKASLALIHLIEYHDALLLNPSPPQHNGEQKPPLPDDQQQSSEKELDHDEVKDLMDVDDVESVEEMDSEGGENQGVVKVGDLIRISYKVKEAADHGQEMENGRCTIIVGSRCVIPEFETALLEALARGESSGSFPLQVSKMGAADPFSCFPKVEAEVEFKIVEKRAAGSLKAGGGGCLGLFRPSLGKLRISTFVQSLNDHLLLKAEVKEDQKEGQFTLLDLGCGSCKLITAFVKSQLASGLQRGVKLSLTGIDISAGGLKAGVKSLKARTMSPDDKSKIEIRLFEGNVLSSAFSDPEASAWGAMKGQVDVVTMVEVVEHLDLSFLDQVGASILGGLKPQSLIVSTPNWSYNSVMRESEKIISKRGGVEGGAAWPGPPDREGNPMRCNDHRFEWTAEEFRHWAHPIAKIHGYMVRFEMIGHTVDEGEAIQAISKASNPAAAGMAPDSHREGFGAATQICFFERLPMRGEVDEHTPLSPAAALNQDGISGLALVWSSSAI